MAHQEYTSKTGERYELKKPKDSELLKGDGNVRMITEKGENYVPKKADRYEVQKPKESDIWQVIIFFHTEENSSTSFLLLLYYLIRNVYSTKQV